MKKKIVILISSVVVILLFTIIVVINGGNDTKLVETSKTLEASVQSKEVEDSKAQVVKVEAPKDDKAVKVTVNQKEANLSDKAILSILNNAQESFFKVTRGIKALDNNYGILSEEFNSPDKLEKYLNLYWTKDSTKELIDFIGAKYIENKYSIRLGDAPDINILDGGILKRKQDEGRIYLTVKAYCFGEADNYNFELKFEDNKWVVDYFEGSFSVIGQPNEVKSKEIQNTEVKGKEVTPEKAMEMVWSIVPNKAANTGVSFDHEDIKDGVKYYVIHAFDNMSTHVATRGWYYVNPKDGSIYEWDLVRDKLNLIVQ
jgi:hypothetical protein